MSQTDTSSAHWTATERHVVRITDGNDRVLGSYPIGAPGYRPGPETLWDTGWHAYPGSEWQEEPPGFWSCPVFRHDIKRQR